MALNKRLLCGTLIIEVLFHRGFQRSKYEPCCFILDPNGCIDDYYVIVCLCRRSVNYRSKCRAGRKREAIPGRFL
jgi:hypothetical protein